MPKKRSIWRSWITSAVLQIPAPNLCDIKLNLSLVLLWSFNFVSLKLCILLTLKNMYQLCIFVHFLDDFHFFSNTIHIKLPWFYQQPLCSIRNSLLIVCSHILCSKHNKIKPGLSFRLDASSEKASEAWKHKCGTYFWAAIKFTIFKMQTKNFVKTL